METDLLYLENLDEYVYDEEKIVTYRWLSNTLQVHVNSAKQMLERFVDEQRSKKLSADITVTYFVSGLQDDENSNKCHRCCIVSEDGLDSKKSSLSPITSCHIYSVQKAKLTNSDALYTADYDGIKETLSEPAKHSAIVCSWATKQATAELDERRKRNLSHIADSNAQVVPQSTNGSSNSSSTSWVNKGKAAQKKGAGAALAGMFMNASKKETQPKTSEKKGSDGTKTSQSAKSETKDTAVKTEKPLVSSKGKAPAAGVISFFSKPGKTTTITKTESKEDNPVKATDTKKTSAKSESSPKEDEKTSKRGQTSKLEQSDEEDPVPQKKRRRIRPVVVDSSSEEETEKDAAIDVDAESPIPQPQNEPEDDNKHDEKESRIPSPEKRSPVKSKASPSKDKNETTVSQNSDDTIQRKRKRRRKLVPKTFMDEEGFMVTEKVWESESTDASEAEEPVKKMPVQNKKPVKAQDSKKTVAHKAASPSKGNNKQASLMSFFKKK